MEILASYHPFVLNIIFLRFCCAIDLIAYIGNNIQYDVFVLS